MSERRIGATATAVGPRGWAAVRYALRLALLVLGLFTFAKSTWPSG